MTKKQKFPKAESPSRRPSPAKNDRLSKKNRTSSSSSNSKAGVGPEKAEKRKRLLPLSMSASSQSSRKTTNKNASVHNIGPKELLGLYKQALHIEQNIPLSKKKINMLRDIKKKIGRMDRVMPRREKLDSKYIPYPSIQDPKFGEILSKKKEIRQGSTPGFDRLPKPLNPDKLWEQRCNAQEFVLSPNQHLLKNLISPLTPYNGLLMFHGVGVGKTCSAISIAEQFPDRRVIVVTPLDKQDFLGHVFNMRKLRMTESGVLDVQYAANQCTGSTYINRLSGSELLDLPTIEAHITRMINQKYQIMTFYGFAKEVHSLLGTTFQEGDNNDNSAGLKRLHDRFSGTIIIVDEAHRLRAADQKSMSPSEGEGREGTRQEKNESIDDEELQFEDEYGNIKHASIDAIDIHKTKKPVTNALKMVLEYSENIKLLLLTATPMYNDTRDILDILNMLLINDKKKPLKKNDIFDKGNNLTEAGKQRLVNATKGYVSYMRGDDPFSYPARFIPAVDNDPKLILPLPADRSSPSRQRIPTKDAAGNEIPASDRLSLTPLLASDMGKFQQEVYKATTDPLRNNKPIKDNSFKFLEEIDDPEELAMAEGQMGDILNETSSHTNNQVLQGLSNIVYPLDASESPIIPAVGQPDASDIDLAVYGARRGFPRCFKRVNPKEFKFKYAIRKPDGSPYPFLHPDHIALYAPKIKAIVDRILSSDGVVFVYSRFLSSGLFPLAIALEHVGFSRYGHNSNILLDESMKSNSSTKTLKRVAPKGSTYISLTAQKEDFSTDYMKEIAAATSPDNVDGKIVKVILASDKASEGIDLKFIRAVHILEPWYHFNRIEQIVGRAARTCSHALLPLEKRNVTIYMHAALHPRMDRETVDVWMYRLAESKQKRVLKIENILMNSAIDCSANFHGLFYDPRRLDVRIRMITSQHSVLPSYSPGDHPSTHPLHPSRRVKPSCVVVPTLQDSDNIKDIDSSTFDPKKHASGVESCKKTIMKLFEDQENRQLFFKFEDILSKCLEKYSRIASVDSVIIALQSLLDERLPMKDWLGRDGYLVFADDKYIFQQKDAFDERDPIRRRERMAPKLTDKVVFNPVTNKSQRFSASSPNQKYTVDPSRTGKSSLKKMNAAIEDLVTRVFPSETVSSLKKQQQQYWNSIVDYVVDRFDNVALLRILRLISVLHVDPELSHFAEQSFGLHFGLADLVRSLRDGHVILNSNTNINQDWTFYDYFNDDYIRIVKNDGEKKLDTQKEKKKMQSFLEAKLRDEVGRVSFDGVRGALLQKVRNSDTGHTEAERLKQAFDELAGYVMPVKTKVAPSSFFSSSSINFKLVGPSQGSSGFACHQTSSVKVDDIAKMIRDMDGTTAGPQSGKLDKRGLCARYELALRKNKPMSFSRPAVSARLFKTQQGKLRNR